MSLPGWMEELVEKHSDYRDHLVKWYMMGFDRFGVGNDLLVQVFVQQMLLNIYHGIQQQTTD
jgi:hypothetical protein